MADNVEMPADEAMADAPDPAADAVDEAAEEATAGRRGGDRADRRDRGRRRRGHRGRRRGGGAAATEDARQLSCRGPPAHRAGRARALLACRRGAGARRLRRGRQRPGPGRRDRRRGPRARRGRRDARRAAPARRGGARPAASPIRRKPAAPARNSGIRRCERRPAFVGTDRGVVDVAPATMATIADPESDFAALPEMPAGSSPRRCSGPRMSARTGSSPAQRDYSSRRRRDLERRCSSGRWTSSPAAPRAPSWPGCRSSHLNRGGVPEFGRLSRGSRRADRLERGAGADADPRPRVLLAPRQPPLPGGQLHPHAARPSTTSRNPTCSTTCSAMCRC